MANQIPFSGATNAAGQFLLPPAQGQILVNAILTDVGAIALAGDKRATSSRRTQFPVWEGLPTAGPVGEGAKKPVTGASLGQATINVKKFASIILFTDEMVEDLMNGDLNILVDSSVRLAIAKSIDAHATGVESGVEIKSVFDSALLASGGEGVTIEATTGVGVAKGVSAALGKLESRGYGDPSEVGVLLGFGFQQLLRDAVDGQGRPLYNSPFGGQSLDALYGLDRAHSSNLTGTSAAASTFTVVKAAAEATKIKVKTRGTAPLYVGQPISGEGIPAGDTIKALVGTPGEETEIELTKALTAESKEAAVYTAKNAVGVVFNKNNVHVRVRKDITVATSNEASIEVKEGETRNLFSENLQALRYECRVGYMIHDAARAVVPLYV